MLQYSCNNNGIKINDLLVGLRRLATGEDSDKIPHFHQSISTSNASLATGDRRNATTPITVFSPGDDAP
jgi:hypothetical protein